ncbi:hypothetical protein D9M68_972650 [compost metagenome]
MHREAADVATGEKQRRDHMAVGGHDEASLRRVESGQSQHCAVVALAQELIVKSREEQLFDQLRRGLAARAMTHVDAAVLDVQRPDVGLLHPPGRGRFAAGGLLDVGSHGVTSSVAVAATMGMSRKRP